VIAVYPVALAVIRNGLPLVCNEMDRAIASRWKPAIRLQSLRLEFVHRSAAVRITLEWPAE
jgi:hypothetical protein